MIKIKDLFDKNDVQKRSGVQCKQIDSILDKRFTEKLNKTLQKDNKIFNNPNFKLNKSNDKPLITSNNGRDMSPVPKNNEFDMSFTTEPNPVPKPPRTFAHDVYLQLKFNTKNSNVNHNNLEENLNALYSKPNKANKLKNRLRSQSDSQIMENKKSNEFNSSENIYDDCTNTTNINKTLKSKLLQFSCLKLKRR